MAPDVKAQDRWVLVAKLSGAHGAGGDVKLVSFTADPSSVAQFRDVRNAPDGAAVRFRVIRSLKGASFAVRVDGVRNREEAALLRGVSLYVRRAELPVPGDEEYYHEDLIGLTAENEAGARIGEVKAVEDHGGGDLLEIMLDAPLKPFGRIVMLPFTRAYVPIVDLENGRIVARINAWALENEADQTA